MGGEPEQQLLVAATEGKADVVQRLLENDVDVAYQNDEGASALMLAAENGHTHIVKDLLEAGAPWNAQDKEGYCAGEYASGGKHSEIMEMLMEWGVQAELLLGAAARQAAGDKGQAANADYLQQRLTYKDEKLLDADGEAVMMGWEAPLMERHAEVIAHGGGKDVLNVGFGLGLVDTYLQAHSPRSHTIIEAHPDVYEHMQRTGWTSRPGVTVLFGRWQDVLPQLQQYDGIFFDTYGEYYEELREFQLQLPTILRPGGTYSFFNGLASDNFFFHTVYSRLIQVELQQLGITTEYRRVPVDPLEDKVWEGVRNKYWHFPLYYLPICTRGGAASAQQQQVAAAAEMAGEEGAGAATKEAAHKTTA